jgi:hypothetical protein
LGKKCAVASAPFANSSCDVGNASSINWLEEPSSAIELLLMIGIPVNGRVVLHFEGNIQSVTRKSGVKVPVEEMLIALGIGLLVFLLFDLPLLLADSVCNSESLN